LDEYHVSKNENPISYFKESSGAVLWWKCKLNENHVWKTRISARTNKKNPTGCKFCSGRS
jgi:hypothetical protein